MALKRQVIDKQQVVDLRKRTRLSQAQFAAKLYVHVMTVSRWERGESQPSQVHLRQMRQLWGFALGGKAEERRNGS